MFSITNKQTQEHLHWVDGDTLLCQRATSGLRSTAPTFRVRGNGQDKPSSRREAACGLTPKRAAPAATAAGSAHSYTALDPPLVPQASQGQCKSTIVERA